MLRYVISLLIGCFYTTLISINEIILIIKHGRKYFCFPKWHSDPECLKNSQFGEHKTAQLKSKIKLHYVESGDPNKPLMLFVHGFPEFWYSWRHQILEFQKTHRIMAIDMRGYGRSDKPQDVASYKIDNLVNDIKEFLEYVNVSKCILVSHDWGGMVCWVFLTQYPQFVERAIFLNIPHPKAFRRTLNTNWKQFLSSWYMFFFQLPFFPEWLISRLDMDFIDTCFDKLPTGNRLLKLTSEEILAFKSNFMRPGAITAAVNYYRASMRYPPTKRLSTIDPKLPIMLIWGENDTALTQTTAEASKIEVPHLDLRYVAGASHWVQQDAPQQVNGLIHGFLGKED